MYIKSRRLAVLCKTPTFYYMDYLLLEEEITVVLDFRILIEFLHEIAGILHHSLLLCCHNSLLVILHRTVGLLHYLEEIYTTIALYRTLGE